MSEKILQFYSGIDTNELAALDDALTGLHEGDELVLDFCNGGGSVFHGTAMCDKLTQASARGIKTIARVWGYAASAACLVALSCDVVEMSPNAALMYHSAWSTDGNDDPAIPLANSIQETILSKRISKISAKDFNGEDHWITASTAQALGIIDSIIGNPVSDEDSNDIRVAAQYIGGKRMEEVKKEEILEEKVEEKVDASEDCGEKPTEEPKAAEDLDLMEAIVQRLEGIERRLGVLESEGKTQEDLDHKEEGVSARRQALMQKLSAVCAPVPSVASKPVAVAETPEEENARFKAMYKNFDDIVSSYIRRK
jgi:ATP-dependent protease ClpP protease subunit